eukprot:277276-Chlamydomonas_euryale.AAC.3
MSSLPRTPPRCIAAWATRRGLTADCVSSLTLKPPLTHKWRSTGRLAVSVGASCKSRDRLVGESTDLVWQGRHLHSVHTFRSAAWRMRGRCQGGRSCAKGPVRGSSF